MALEPESETEILQANSKTTGGLNPNQQENIKVAVRLRPFTEKEKQKKNQRIIEIEKNTILLKNPKHSNDRHKKFTFDYSYWSHDGFKKNDSGVNVPDLSHPNGSKYVDQEKVFNDLGRFLLDNALKGYHSALLAYGQTGSGKSYTVSGYGANEGILARFARSLFIELDKSCSPNRQDADKEFKHEIESETTNQTSNIGNPVEQTSEAHKQRYEVYFSMIEIYNEVVRDLLDKGGQDESNIHSGFTRRGLKVREHPMHGFFVEKLSSFICNNKEEIERRIEEGQLNKSIAATRMNETSSRGHTIYEFKIKQYKSLGPDAKADGEDVTCSVVQLVDLAGSERMAVHAPSDDAVCHLSDRSITPIERLNTNLKGVKSGKAPIGSPQKLRSGNTRRSVNNNNSLTLDSHQRFKESISINQSLSALGNCIQVMSQYSQQLEHGNHDSRVRVSSLKIPYRDSVLTKLLNRCCLSGNSKVVIIATLGPADVNFDDTLSTLRFADRAKQIRTHATINRMSIDEGNQGKYGGKSIHKRIKHISRGDQTKSDDSSQTSNFDCNENIAENFSGSKISQKSSVVDTTSTTTSRSMTSIKRSGTQQAASKRAKDKSTNRGSKRPNESKSKLTGSSSNPSLAIDTDQMKRLVSPASQANFDTTKGKTMRKSLSSSHELAMEQEQTDAYDNDDATFNREDYDDFDLNDLRNIHEGLISPESDDSVAALADEDLSTDEKIEILNRMLNSVPSEKIQTIQEDESEQVDKLSVQQQKTKRSRMRAEIKQVSIISSTLKKTNPYLSNLNPDEQLSGVISFMIRHGDTIVGKDVDCDVVLHGPEIRGKHAKIIRIENQQSGESGKSKIDTKKQPNRVIYLEPLYLPETTPTLESNVKVNGQSISERVKLNHCDRILFGTNSYFVFADLADRQSSSEKSQSLADLDLITYETARNEVLRGVIGDEKNKEVIKEINDYTHRPGTGKHRVRSLGSVIGANTKGGESASQQDASDSIQKLTRSLTLHDKRLLDDKTTVGKSSLIQSENIDPEQHGNNENHDQDAIYRNQLMEDTYDYVIPVTEVNAVAQEMGIKVSYELKILTGEEQWPSQASNNFDTYTPDGFSSSSLADSVDNSEANKVPSKSNTYEDGHHTDSTSNAASIPSKANEDITYLSGLDGLDIPPALFVKVHIETNNIDFYWSKEKFQARRYKILELYSPWSVAGKSGLVEYLIEQARIQGSYLIDPFVDDPTSCFVLIGHAQVTLQPIAHLTDKSQTYDIVDLNDEIVGTIYVQAIPCHSEEIQGEADRKTYKLFDEDDLKNKLLDNPSELLGRKLVFILKIISCNNISAKFCNIFCQYALSSKVPLVRSKIYHETELQANEGGLYDNLEFAHSHFICFQSVNEEILEFLQYGFLTIQVVGQYKLQANGRPVSMVSTIINSINKYKSKMEQRSGYGSANYSNGDYYTNSANSSKSNREPGGPGTLNGESGVSSAASTSTTANTYDQRNEFDENGAILNGIPQENIIDMILTKRKLDRAENQLVSLTRSQRLN